jgi:hypothetical protein
VGWSADKYLVRVTPPPPPVLVIHDTLYVHDTVSVKIDSVILQMLGFKVASVVGDSIVVIKQR